jgi:enoyl-CoA hydratase
MPDLQIEASEQILSITFNRPHVMNAWTVEMVQETRNALNEAAREGRQRVVIFRGAGGHYCAGADIRAEKNCTLAEYRAFISDIQEISRALRRMDAVSIAAIHGYCLGGGMELACACDLRIASEDARLGFPEVALGLTATSGTAWSLPRLIGAARAKEMTLTGDWIDAARAERIGLVNRVVPLADLATLVQDLAVKIISRAPLAVAAQKHLLDAAADGPLDATLQCEVDAILTLFASRDGQEGLSAFLEKRAPRFTDT